MTPANWLSDLSRRPWLLFAVLAAINAVARPNLGYVHDAQLYAGQVLHAVDPEAWKGDLFFEFGSQDRYSLFSRIVAPMVRLIGIDAAFFVIYLASAAIFLASLIRLTFKLLPGSPGAVVGLVYLCTAMVTYGGQNVFHVFEAFTTPRLIASGFALLGLSLTLERRGILACLVFAMAMVCHPLMAYPAILLAAAHELWRWFGVKTLIGLALLACLGIGVVFSMPELSERLFGSIDMDWLDMIRWCSTYHFPKDWDHNNWTWAFLGIGMAFVGANVRGDHRGFFILLACVGLLGIIGSVIVCELLYAVPLMGQPYRTLWLTSLFFPILGLDFAWKSWEGEAPAEPETREHQKVAQVFQRRRLGGSLALPRGTGLRRLASIAVLLCLIVTTTVRLEHVALIAFTPLTYIAVVRHRIRSGAPSGGSLLPAIVFAIFLGACVWSILRICIFYYVAPTESPKVLVSFYVIAIYIANFGVGLFFLAGVYAAYYVARRRNGAAWTIGLLGFAFAWQLAVSRMPATTQWAGFDPHPGQAREVGRFLDAHRQDRPLCVYSNLNRLDLVWLEMRSQCYLDLAQTAGFVFGRSTAEEGRRRTHLAGPFEMERVRSSVVYITDMVRDNYRTMFQVEIDDPPPSRADLLRLCADPRLDFIVLWDLADAEFADLATANLDGVLVFDCRLLRGAQPSLVANDARPD